MTCVANFPREQRRRHAMVAAYLVALVLAGCTIEAIPAHRRIGGGRGIDGLQSGEG
jgi:hypothetical protein